MTNTARDIIEEAYRTINVIDAAGQMTAAQLSRGKISYNALHKWLESELKARWDKEDVPDEYMESVAGMLSERLARKTPSAEMERGMAAATMGERELRQQLAKRPRKTVKLSSV